MNEHVNPQTLTNGPASALAGPVIQLLKSATIVTEMLLIAQALVTSSWQVLALGHATVVTTLIGALILLEMARAATRDLPMFTLLVLVGGPIGGTAALVGEQRVWRLKTNVLEQWYDTIAPAHEPAVTLVDRIMDGRLVRQQSGLPRPYDSLLSSGTMQEKQGLLAYLAATDDEKFVESALAMALRSTDQRVRVQAAAVAAHTRARRRSLRPFPPGSPGSPPLPPASPAH